MMVIVTGASGSGKSEYAEQLIQSLGDCRRLYVATMIPWGGEGERRVARHRKMRETKGFETVECYKALETIDLPGAAFIHENMGKTCRDNTGCPGRDVTQKPAAILLECLSNVTANLMFSDATAPFLTENAKGVADKVMEGIRYLKNRSEHLIVVTNEVFSDGEEYPEETEIYRQILGEVNISAAFMADMVVEVVAGISLLLKSPAVSGGKED